MDKKSDRKHKYISRELRYIQLYDLLIAQIEQECENLKAKMWLKKIKKTEKIQAYKGVITKQMEIAGLLEEREKVIEQIGLKLSNFDQQLQDKRKDVTNIILERENKRKVIYYESNKEEKSTSDIQLSNSSSIYGSFNTTDDSIYLFENIEKQNGQCNG